MHLVTEKKKTKQAEPSHRTLVLTIIAWKWGWDRREKLQGLS